jgi:hypothetical protein
MQPQKADVALRSSEWNMGSRSAAFLHSTPPPLSLSPSLARGRARSVSLPGSVLHLSLISYVSLATGRNSPLTNGSTSARISPPRIIHGYGFSSVELPPRDESGRDARRLRATVHCAKRRERRSGSRENVRGIHCREITCDCACEKARRELARKCIAAGYHASRPGIFA